MHEVSIAVDLQKIILEVADKHKLNKVSTINIQFGEMVQIIPDIFQSAFKEVCRGSLSEGAEVKIEILPVKIKCVRCFSELEILKYDYYTCKKCNSTDIEIIQGKEVLIKSIEGE